MNKRLARGLVLLAALIVATLLTPPSASSSMRALTIEERVRAQAALERVYWSHRIWPEANPGPKPALEAVMPASAIRSKVEDYLRKSNALEALGSRPITSAQLQAEMTRMARDSQRPDVLAELQHALGDDPFLVAECLARPTLADRLAQSWYAQDPRFHGELRSEAERAVAAHPSLDGMRKMGGRYNEITFVRGRDGEQDRSGTVSLTDDEWQALEEKRRTSAPLLRLGALQETDEAYSVSAVLREGDGEVSIASVSWSKRSFEDWWQEAASSVSSALAVPAAAYTLEAAPLVDCTNDTWTATRAGAPDPRLAHKAVWTGSEMIVWGGTPRLLGICSGSGFRYNPATDTWTQMSNANAPGTRENHTAVWTGTQMIVWGGDFFEGGFNIFRATGGRYDPASDTWLPTSTGANVPSDRTYHAAVWTGTRMIVWGGQTNGDRQSGGRYDPVTDTWLSTSTVGAPSGRAHVAGVWSGSEMIVWGGGDGGSTQVNTGGRYNPTTDSWVSTSTGANVPSARDYHTAVWTGSRMIVWGGHGGVTNTGGSYDPGTDTWLPTSTGANVPAARFWHTAVWTGTEMVVWGGWPSAGPMFSSGGRYDPGADTWTATSLVGAAAGRSFHTAVWTGSEMIVWGGTDSSNRAMNTGGRYSPASNTWVPTASQSSAPSPRMQHTAVWTGAEMIVWGGNVGTPTESFSWVPLSTGGRYDPATDTWAATAAVSAPLARLEHTAIWDGIEMIVWGGRNANTAFNTGSRYDPGTNSWAATGTAPVAGSSGHTAVWTGTEMIVWSGNSTNSGGRYNPPTNTWLATSTGANVPSLRFHHTAVWTGSRMVVWGGSPTLFPSSTLSTGGVYDPSTNTWSPTSTGANLPSARFDHTAVWTGSRMIVWGGQTSTSAQTNTGALYDPTADTWTPTSTAGSAPSVRTRHRAIWTGTEMIVWGGGEANERQGQLATGGRYDPASNAWTPTSTGAGLPSSRFWHTAVRTIDRMIVWGGDPLTQTGGMYCALPCTTSTWYQDADTDGYGNPSATQSACTQPPGYLSTAGDCADADPARHPGATETCDFVDNNCNGQTDEGWDIDNDGITPCAGDCDNFNQNTYPGAPQICDGSNNDCSDPSWPAVPANEANADHDAYRICQGDCDDTRASVYPNAPQLCDGLNNRCNDPSWPTVPANEADADGDGFRGCSGECNDGNAAVHPGAPEVCNGIDDDCDSATDEDAQGIDSDSDGVRNACDNCRFSPNPTQLDSDGDQVGNACDNCIAVVNQNQADTDADAVGNACDNCPLNANATQNDGDADFSGDACDNCPFSFNPTQSDSDEDGEGDVCDENDGLIWEFREDKTSVSWQAEQGPTTWNLYIGDLAVLKATGVYTQAPGSNALADRQCGLTQTFGDDLGVPAAGAVSFSLVTGVEGGVEGGLGSSSSGPRMNANPCP